MDTSTLAPAAPSATAVPAPHSAPPADADRTAPSVEAPRVRSALAAEVRESVLLLGFAVGVTLGLTTAAQAALALLG